MGADLVGREKALTRMGATAPRAFISYTDVEPDCAVAQAIERVFVASGYDVWSMRQEQSAGREWLDGYEDAIEEAHVLLAVVSRRYLSRDQCRQEVRLAYDRRIADSILLYPFMLEGIDAEQLSAEEARTLKRLAREAGFGKKRVPAKEEIEQAALAIRRSLEKRGMFTPEAEPNEGSVALPLVEKPAATRGDVFLVLDEAAASAAAVRRVLISEPGARQSGRGRWTVARSLLDGSLRQRLQDSARSASEHGDGGRGQ